MKNLQLKGNLRDVVGRKVKRLRREGLIPGVIYGKDQKSVSVTVDKKEFEKIFKDAGETNLVDLEIGKDNYPVLIHNIQTHPVSDVPLHIDFLKVNLKVKVTVKVPVEIVGVAPAEKQGLGTLVKYVDEIEVECLPSDIPDKFEVDVSNLSEVDSMIQVKDLKLDSKVEIKQDLEDILVKVEPQAKEEELPAPTPAEGEGAVAGETPVEGAAGAGETASKEETPSDKAEK